ncbi:MAG: phosphoglycerate dehydrogenase [Anaerolineae bacterium]
MTNENANSEIRNPKSEIPPRVLVCDPLGTAGIELLQQHATVDVKTGLNEAALIDIIGNYSAMVVRSGTRVTSAVIDAASKDLQVIGRAGVGTDNIDIDAATRRGIIVVNSPTANTIAAAEQAIALMLAVARQVPQADGSLRQGRWERKKFVGVEVRNKVLGIIGLGRIGTEVAKRAQGLEMKIIAYDPYVSADHAARYDVQFMDLPSLLQKADFITLHTPLTPDTRNMINEETLAMMKPSARLINCARGGLIDEEALLKALDEGKIAGAALDVFSQEPPPADHPLLHHPKVIVTPHLGGSTEEAQAGVALDIAEQVITVLEGRLPKHAVNAPIVSAETLDALVPYFDLAQRLGRFYTQIAPGRRIERVRIVYSGELAQVDTTPIKAAVVKGLLESIIEERVNLVNAHVIAKTRGLSLIEEKHSGAEPFANVITLEVTANGQERSIAGTVMRGMPHVVRVDEYWIDLVPDGYLLVCYNEDRPGMIGQVGTILGRGDINIAFMQVGRVVPRGRAMMVLGLDEPIPDPVLEQVLAVPGLYDVTQVKM